MNARGTFWGRSASAEPRLVKFRHRMMYRLMRCARISREVDALFVIAIYLTHWRFWDHARALLRSLNLGMSLLRRHVEYGTDPCHSSLGHCRRHFMPHTLIHFVRQFNPQVAAPAALGDRIFEVG